MSYTNAQVVEKFINGGVGSRKTYSNSTDTLYAKMVDRTTRDLYSYNTLIAQYKVDKGIVFLSDNGLTSTTNKHRLELMSALSKAGIKGYQIPVRMHQSTLPTFEELLGRFEARMDSLSMGTDLALADNRHDFTRNYNLYKELIEVTGLTPVNVSKYDDIMAKVDDAEYIKAIQRERRKFMSNKNKMYADTIKDKEYFNNSN